MPRRNTLPLKEGVGRGRRVYGDAAAGPPLQKLKSGGTLAELQTEYVLFSYAPLFLFGGLEHNPVQEWINAHDHSQIVFILQLTDPVLHMGKAPRWDRTLWAVEKAYWPSLSLHIGSMAFLDRARKRLTRVICQELPVPDVAAMAKISTVTRPPQVNILVFGVDSNKGCLAFVPGLIPQLKFHTPRTETVKLADALLAGHVNPYQSAENSNEDQDPPPSTIRS